MSLGKFLKRLWLGIGKIFRGINKELRENIIPIAIEITNNLKLIDESHIGDVLASIIPGEADDKILADLRTALPKWITGLAVAANITQDDDINATLKRILAAINVAPEDAKKVFYHGLASLIIEKLADGKLDWSDATAIAEYYYQHEHDNDNEGK